jgi:ribosomal protein L16/L10AE
MADDDDLNDTIEVMASFLTLRVGVGVVVATTIEKQKNKHLAESNTKKTSNYSANEQIEALESTAEDIRIAHKMLEAAWKAAERALLKIWKDAVFSLCR